MPGAAAKLRWQHPGQERNRAGGPRVAYFKNSSFSR
jgi:hypothetical protein